VIARVGSELILESEVLPIVEPQLAAMMQQNTLRPELYEPTRQRLMRQALEPLIERKLVLAAVRRKAPDAALENFEKKANEQFDKEIARDMMEKSGSRTRAELEEKLRQTGSSLAHQRKIFFERSLSSDWIRNEVNLNPEISHDDMLAYYRDHQEVFAYKPQVRWEELVVRFGSGKSKSEAWRQLADLGNRVWRGEPLADVARESSEGVTAHKGGLRDWVSQGSLVSKTLDEALFSQPLGRLSPILEDGDAFYIVRVLDRRPAGVVPFSEAQLKIREELRQQKIDEQIKQYIEQLRKQTPVWTMFDGPQQ
jgi:parvulin-like peptidyl-prolyl isomerase